MRLPGTTPADPSDTGGADEELAAALAARDVDRVHARLPHARLLVPVVAVPAEESAGEAEMAVPLLVNDDGARALPVFTCLDSLQLWRADARPVPMPGARVLAAAIAEGYDGVVVDVAGPVSFTVQAANLARLLA